MIARNTPCFAFVLLAAFLFHIGHPVAGGWCILFALLAATNK